MTKQTTRTLDLIRQVEANAKPEPAGLSRALAEALQRIRELESKLSIATARPLAIPTKAASTPAKAASQSPLTDRLSTLTGAEKTSFYRANADGLRSEQISAKYPNTITPNTKTK